MSSRNPRGSEGGRTSADDDEVTGPADVVTEAFAPCGGCRASCCWRLEVEAPPEECLAEADKPPPREAELDNLWVIRCTIDMACRT